MATAAPRVFRRPASALPGPGAASPASPGGVYAGSRKETQRFAYSAHSTAGFVELAPKSFGAASWNDRLVAATEFYDALAKVPGVAEVPCARSKEFGGVFAFVVLAFARISS